jgi:chromosome segregation ATPase
MPDPINAPRKFAQLDNDIHSIYELLSTIEHTQNHHGARLDGIDFRLGTLESRFGVLESRFGTLESKVDTLESKVDTLDTKVDSLVGKVEIVIDILRGQGSSGL